MKAVIVGCVHIAEQHIKALRSIPYARLAAGLRPEATLSDGLDTVRLLDVIWPPLSRTE
jgi:hypothetical protein